MLNDDDPAKIFPQGIPNMAVAPNRRVDIAWWDLRNDPGISFGNDVHYASSSDNGATWSKNMRVTGQLGPNPGRGDRRAGPQDPETTHDRTCQGRRTPDVSTASSHLGIHGLVTRPDITHPDGEEEHR